MPHNKSKTDQKRDNGLKWWREARFGMFIHWGLYAVPAGRWKNRKIEGIGEWIMNRARIPVSEYETLAKAFNPVRFDARQWVKLAADAGMKYLVITAKHHDGFAMFESPCNPYNIVEATPWGKDPMRELARECQRAGIKLCFYYSQSQDWHDPDGMGNTWDYPDETKKNFDAYLKRKCRPQIKELLTQYGEIGLIWFDTPKEITRSQSLGLKRLVHQLQAACLVSGRIGNDVGDYGSLGDNKHPTGAVEGDWETPCTLNNTWGYKSDDRHWKSVEQLVHLLVNCASKGVNYLLNVGPTAEGVIPAASVERLRKIGNWLKINGEAVYGTQGTPWPEDFEWGRVTRKKGKLYLHVMKWPAGKLVLPGLRNPVREAWVLGAPNARVSVEQEHNRKTDRHEVMLRLPRRKPHKLVPVIALNITGDATVSANR